MTTTTHPPVPVTAALKAELIKFTTVPRRALQAAACVLGGLAVGVLLLVSLPVTQGTTVATIPDARSVIDAAILGVDAAAFAMILLAAGVGGGEHRTGQAGTTYLLTPRRGRVVTAQALVVGGVGLLVGLLTAAGALAIGEIALVVTGRPALPLDGELLRLAAGTALTPLFYGLVALAGAQMLRGVAGGVLVAFGLLALPTVLAWLGAPGAVFLLPAAALHSMAGLALPGSTDYLPVAAAALSLVGWTLLALGLARWRVDRADV